ncbi:MAG: dihydrodipicolinate reductase C-terminal domain-containing protein [Rhodoferax sp.]|uniref:4-hydroxy-tetrahydrodipicolinate reductase n=1 Tax=Rhodoferax sp. TaxID=50421 RepID=UPI002ACDE6CF|nr:dihydrodipicolinate reductase C-terminal domain-containing protein [Rhodoferax sp.]MDZ7891504.1 dihydrodipicolinate reductase C-terminal domain-containing protein [Rhodoferax sp.]
MKVGLIGYGKAGSAVAQVLSEDPRYDLQWIATRSGNPTAVTLGEQTIPVTALTQEHLSDWLDQHPVDALVDFSNAASAAIYSDEVQRRGLTVVTAISSYDDSQLDRMRELGKYAKVLCSPNITVGINFLIMAARLLREIAPFADVEILEQHFRDKPEVSGTAKKIAESLDVGGEKITSMRLGGIVGHHEVIFGFPYQTVRLIHDSIKREAFGTGAAFALNELRNCPQGFYTFDDLLMKRVRAQILAGHTS